MKADNKIVVDLNKVCYAKLHYETFTGEKFVRETKPKGPTMYGVELNELPAVTLPTGIKQSAFLWAKERNRIDGEWIPVLTLQLCNSHSLVYTGNKALILWKEWCAKIFGKKK